MGKGQSKQTPEYIYSKPQGLYPECDWDDKTIRKLIIEKKLAPCYPGSETAGASTEECPICFLNYPGGLNRSKCCRQGICTECFLQVKKPKQRDTCVCPFCNARRYGVTFTGPLSTKDVQDREVEEQRTIEAQIQAQRTQEKESEERRQERLAQANNPDPNPKQGSGGNDANQGGMHGTTTTSTQGGIHHTPTPAQNTPNAAAAGSGAASPESASSPTPTYNPDGSLYLPPIQPQKSPEFDIPSAEQYYAENDRPRWQSYNPQAFGDDIYYSEPRSHSRRTIAGQDSSRTSSRRSGSGAPRRTGSGTMYRYGGGNSGGAHHHHHHHHHRHEGRGRMGRSGGMPYGPGPSESAPYRQSSGDDTPPPPPRSAQDALIQLFGRDLVSRETLDSFSGEGPPDLDELLLLEAIRRSLADTPGGEGRGEGEGGAGGEGEGEREREGEGEGQEDKQGEEETVPEENEVDVKGPFPPDHVYTREQLLYTFSQLVADPDRYNAGRRDRVTIGFVGFPNVGKSSTINVLYGKKRVAVGATPGKTKHFQTLLVGDDIELCDCPGLVFPSTATTKAEMTCNGVLPIDQMRDHRGPIDHLARIVPRTVFEVTYGITLPRPHQDEDASRPPSVEEVTFTLARNRGFMTNAGPDGSRAARLILKDYVNGKLLHCHPPPGFTPSAEDMPVPHAAASAGGGAETTSGDQHSIDVTELREMQHAGKTLKVNKIYANQVAEGGLSIEEALGNNNVYDTKSGASLAGRKGGKRRLKGGKKTKKGQGDAMFTRVTNTHFTPVPRQQLQAMLKQGKGKGKGAGAVQ
eukprot:TRINITY_DN964_c0_g1_i1.p1 TRINITY_DN964_c0_g1~~TRINITY_DN964_c0_g1_i1.p1  ORF type:complete len:804 (+),score=154.92 TRINITY_DN964_c0_g1_i1:348-2759(+)